MLEIQELQVQGSNSTDQIHLSNLTPEELLLTGGGFFDSFPNFNKFVVLDNVSISSNQKPIISIPSNQKPISVSGFPNGDSNPLGQGF